MGIGADLIITIATIRIRNRQRYFHLGSFSHTQRNLMRGMHSMYPGIGIATQTNGHSGLFRLFLFRNKVNRTHPQGMEILVSIVECIFQLEATEVKC